MNDVTYRPLTIEDWPQLVPIFSEHDVLPPDPRTATIMGAFAEDSTLVGFHVLQPVFHAEPIWVAPSHKQNGVGEGLLRELSMLCTNVPGLEYYIFAPQSRPAYDKLLADAGYEKMPYEVWLRRVPCRS